MRISDWSSDVCSSDLVHVGRCVEMPEPLRDAAVDVDRRDFRIAQHFAHGGADFLEADWLRDRCVVAFHHHVRVEDEAVAGGVQSRVENIQAEPCRSEEHTSELHSLMRISYAVFCLKKKNTHTLS